MISILYWLALISLATAALYWCIDRYSHEELETYNRELEQRNLQAELAYLKTKKTQSRIKNRPDI
jgi:hypothetical protein